MTPFTLRLILSPSGNRFESETGTSFMSRAPLAIGPSICVVRISGAAFRLQGVWPSTASYTDDVAIVAADGLSALAVETNLLPVLNHLRPLLLAHSLTIGSLVLVEQGRVAIGDEIGQLLGARLVVVLIGERPGLSATDSLGAYITWRPRGGAMDLTRNCIFNIRPAGLPPEDAATQIVGVIELASKHAMTGVQLNDLRGTEAILLIGPRGQARTVMSCQNRRQMARHSE